MKRRNPKPTKAMTGEELGKKLLQSVREMQAGSTARITPGTQYIAPAQFAKIIRNNSSKLERPWRAKSDEHGLHPK